MADGTAKLSGRDYDSRVLAQRREQLVRGEDLSGEIQGESRESQPAEPTDDAEARADFWSIKGDFICRHHNEPRVQLHVPKEETCAIPLRYIDVSRSAHTNLDVLQEKKIVNYWKVDSSMHLSDSWRGFTKFTLYWQRFKRQPDQTMYGQKYGRKLVKPPRIEKSRNGQKRNRSLTMLKNWQEFSLLIQMTRNTGWPASCGPLSLKTRNGLPCGRFSVGVSPFGRSGWTKFRRGSQISSPFLGLSAPSLG